MAQVGTRLLVDWLPPDPRLESFTLLFQKEVAQRICAPVGSSSYSRLSVLVQAWATPKMLFTLGPKHFTPPPKVETAVLGIVPYPPNERLLPPELGPSLRAVTAAAFQQRRKMLRSSLAKIPAPALSASNIPSQHESGIIGKLGAEQLCAMAGVDATLRAVRKTIVHNLDFGAVLGALLVDLRKIINRT